MSVTIREYKRGGWEVDIRISLPDDSKHRQRRRAPMQSKSAAQRWGEDRERTWYQQLTHPRPVPVAAQKTEVETKTEVPTLRVFAPRFVNGYARANRQKPSGIAAKQTILDVHLIPLLGHKPIDAITSEDVQGV